jgi:hypothetical protein
VPQTRVRVRHRKDRGGSNGSDDECVGVWAACDGGEVGQLLDRRLMADPVRATVLGTIRLALDTASVECWCAATWDGSAVAVRSDRRYPCHLVVGVGGQTASDLMASCARACARRVRIGVADQVKKIPGTGARGVQNFLPIRQNCDPLTGKARKGRKRHVRMSPAAS